MPANIGRSARLSAAFFVPAVAIRENRSPKFGDSEGRRTCWRADCSSNQPPGYETSTPMSQQKRRRLCVIRQALSSCASPGQDRSLTPSRRRIGKFGWLGSKDCSFKEFDDAAHGEVHDDLMVLHALPALDRTEISQQTVVTVAHTSQSAIPEHHHRMHSQMIQSNLDGK
jgi:hypothetical protein